MPAGAANRSWNERELVDKNKVGIVVIGRNESHLIERVLQSALATGSRVVYVDSGSEDGSPRIARRLEVPTIDLDAAKPFSAGRARNEGFHYLLRRHPEITFVQFIDGDCWLADGWLETAVAAMDADPDIAVVFGRRREVAPEATPYNRLCDMEWAVPPGPTAACGGDALMRVADFRQAGGFDPDFAAGEEPELCYRLRQHNRLIWCLNADMTWHSADMVSITQWWRRTLRSGRAYGQQAWTHGRGAERFSVKESLSIWLYAFIIPAFIIAAYVPTNGLSLLLLLIYPWLFYRVYGHRRAEGSSPSDARLYAFYCVLGKFPQLVGQMSFLLTRQSRLIEYKPVPALAIDDPASD